MSTHNDNSIWELPFGQPAELELRTEFGSLTLVPVEPDQVPRLELSRGSIEHIEVHVVGRRAVEIARKPAPRDLLARLRKFRGKLPPDFRFDRLEANERSR